MSDKYITLIEARARQELEQLSQSQQRAIIEAYSSAGKELVRQYRNAGNGTATKAMYASYIEKTAKETEQIIEQYAIKGAQVPLSVEKLIMQQAFKTAGLDTSVANAKFDDIIGKLGMESVKNVIGGKIYKDGAGLSPRIWQASAMANNKIQEVITAGLAQDMGAAKLSKLLQDYVNPTARNTWSNDKIREILGDGYAAWNKNLEYNALRLARTTLSHTATMSMRQAQKVNPYAAKIRWHSVHAVDRTCSICEELDEQVFDTDKCPFDHPNGMCYQTHEFDKSLDEIADELAAWCNGEENEMLDSWWENVSGEKSSIESRLRYFKSAVVDGKDVRDEWTRRDDKFDFQIEDVIDYQGFDGLPKVVDENEFQRLVNENNFICQRVYTAPTQEVLEEYQRSLYQGKWYVDCSTGGSHYGQGMYTASSRNTSVTDYISDEMSRYGKGKVSHYMVETMTLDSSARIVNYKDLMEEMTEYIHGKADALQELTWEKQQVIKSRFRAGELSKEAARKMSIELDNELNEQLDALTRWQSSDYAVLKGYDAVFAESSEANGYTIILNRTKLIIKGE